MPIPRLTDLEQRAAEIAAFATREAYEAAQAAMLAAEGLWYVDGVYYSNAADAVRRRRWAAERAVDDAVRLAAYEQRRSEAVGDEEEAA